MLKRYSQRSVWTAIRATGALLAVLTAAFPATASTSTASPLTPLEQAIARAEASIGEQEPQAAESHYRQALLEGWLLSGAFDVADGDLKAALSAFEQAGSAAVETRRPLHWQALTHLQLDQFDDAIELLTRLVSRHPTDLEARQLLAQALVSGGRFEEAVQELEEAQTAAPDDLEIAYNLASGYLRVGKVERAAPLFERLAEERPIPQTHILIGRSYSTSRVFDRAREAFARAVELDPEIRRGFYYLGTIELLEAGRDAVESAAGHFEKALLREPEEPLINLYLGTARRVMRQFEASIAPLQVAAGHERTRIDGLRFLGGSYLGLDRTTEAVTTLREALAAAEAGDASTRQLSSIHYQLGQALRRSGNEADASHHFSEAQRFSGQQVENERDDLARFLDDQLEQEGIDEQALPPLEVGWLTGVTTEQRAELRRTVNRHLARAYLNLGVLQLQAQRPQRAAPLMARAAEVDATLPGVHFSLGTALFNAGRLADAVAPLSRAFESQRNNPGLRRMLALARLNGGEPLGAAELLRDDPERRTNPSLEYAYGLALMRSNRTVEAQSVFDGLLGRNERWPELHVALGQNHAKQGDFDAAVASLERAIELDAGVAEARSTLGELYMRQGRLDDAERELRGELEAHPGDHQTRYLLALVLDLNRRSDEAQIEVESVLDADSGHADARYLLGKILLAKGSTQDAANHLEAAAELSPRDPNIFNQLGQAYQRLGRADDAKRQFEIFRELKKKERDGDA